MTSDRSGKPHVTLVTSNGAGLGHFARQLAIALALRDDANATIFSLSLGIALARPFGIASEYCPGPLAGFIRPSDWDDYLQARFLAFAEEVQPDVVLFDGVAPYAGLLNAMRNSRATFGWLRRAMWREGANASQLEKAPQFDFVLEPGDYAAAADRGPTTAVHDVIRIPPVTLLDVIEPLDREAAATALGIDSRRPSLLVSFGAGRIGSAESARAAVLEAATSRGWQVCCGTSPIAAKGVDRHEGVTELRGVFPLVRYLSAFDAAVSAAGYNSVHELVGAGIPSLFIANTATSTDDQRARSFDLQRQGVALSSEDRDLDSIARATERLLDPAERDRLAENARTLSASQKHNGANAAAAELTRPRGRSRQVIRTDLPPLRRLVHRALGPAGVAAVRRLRYRKSTRTRRGVIRITDSGSDSGAGRLVFSENHDEIAHASQLPVEHVLPGASSAYRERRRAIIRRYFDVVAGDGEEQDSVGRGT